MDRNSNSRGFVQKLQEYNSKIRSLETANNSPVDKESLELSFLKEERNQLVLAHTQEAMNSKNEWLNNPKLAEAAKKAKEQVDKDPNPPQVLSRDNDPEL